MDVMDVQDPGYNPVKQRNLAGPLRRNIHKMFMDYLKSSPRTCPFPSGPDLKAAGFPKPRGGKTRREKFKLWAERMGIKTDPDTRKDVLIYKRTGKIILPMDEFDGVVRNVHFSSTPHLDVKAIIAQVQKKYTFGVREFGMDKDFILQVLGSCQACCSMTDDSVWLDGDNAADNTSPKSALMPPPSSRTGLLKMPLNVLSMAIAKTDPKGLWFDREGILGAKDMGDKMLFNRLLVALQELRYEMGPTSAGNKDARERLITKISFCQGLIFEYRRHLEDDLKQTVLNEKFANELHSLVLSYRDAGRLDLLETDLDMILKCYEQLDFSDTFLKQLLGSIVNVIFKINSL